MKNLEKEITTNPMYALSSEEVMNVSGGFWPVIFRIVIPSLINIAVYTFKKHHDDEEITPQGLAIAGGAGVVSGGLGVAGGAAAGGGIVGNLVWTPSTVAINCKSLN